MTAIQHLTSFGTLALSAATLMVVAGIGKRKLEWRNVRRACPSCRRSRRACTCRR